MVQNNSFIFAFLFLMNYHGFLDIILVLLAIALFKGKKMVFCRISVIGFIIWIYAAVKFSNFMKMFLAGFVEWNPIQYK
jgi:hypothetical protein